MKREPIDYNSPLGISKREWTRVLGVNLALLLAVYAVALICTLCGSDLFLLNFESQSLTNIETTLRGWGIFPLVQFLFYAIEATIICSFYLGKPAKWWIPLTFYAETVLADLACWAIFGSFPGVIQFAVATITHIILILVFFRKDRKAMGFAFIRFGIATAVSLALNGAIAFMRLKMAELWSHDLPNTALFALNFEYDIALVLSFLFLWLVLPFNHKKGDEKPCLTDPVAGGSSPMSMKSSPTKSRTNTPKKTTSELSPETKKRVRLAKAKVITIQSVAFLVIAFLPWVVGKPVEFSLVYASFCLTRLCLGFSRSLHFKSELVCVTAGAFTFWLLTFLTPSVEACVIMALVYGGATALAFRLYWELHDLLLYRKAAKFDRYAMLYTAFKGNITPKHIYGVMKMKGYAEEDISMVISYMEREKVEAIANKAHYSKRVVEFRLSDIAEFLYAHR